MLTLRAHNSAAGLPHPRRAQVGELRLVDASIGGTWAPDACAITITAYGVADADHAAVQDVLQHDLGSGFVVFATSATISPLDQQGH